LVFSFGFPKYKVHYNDIYVKYRVRGELSAMIRRIIKIDTPPKSSPLKRRGGKKE